MDTQMIGMCGAYCGFCDWKDRTGCPGCQACAGKPFWGACAVAACAIHKGLAHCGHCAGLPCQTLQGAFDNPEHGDQGERLINLQSWARGETACLKLRASGEKS